jgi:PAS domain-containing protein
MPLPYLGFLHVPTLHLAPHYSAKEMRVYVPQGCLLTKSLEIALDRKVWQKQLRKALNTADVIEFRQLYAPANVKRTHALLVQLRLDKHVGDVLQFHCCITLMHHSQTYQAIQSILAEDSIYRGINWHFDCRTNVVHVSEAFARHLGFASTKEMPNTVEGIRALVHPDDVERHIEHYSNAAQNDLSSEFEGRLRRTDGKYVWICCRFVNIVHDDDCQLVMMSGIRTSLSCP